MKFSRFITSPITFWNEPQGYVMNGTAVGYRILKQALGGAWSVEAGFAHDSDGIVPQRCQ